MSVRSDNNWRIHDYMLAQFLLLGDPSLHAVDAVPAHDEAFGEAAADAQAAAKDVRSRRKALRVSLKGEGLAGAATAIGAAASKTSPAVNRVRALAAKRGFTADPDVFKVTGGAKFRAAAKSLGRSQEIAVLSERRPGVVDVDAKIEHTSIRVLVAHILDDGIVAVVESESR